MPVRARPGLGSLETSSVQIPLYFRCPISLELMQDPVILTTGQTYDRSSIEQWVASGNTTCPVTMQKLQAQDLALMIPNHTLRRLIQEWCVANRSRGVQRIPTPKQPADPHRLRSLLADASAAVANPASRIFAIRALRNLIKDSDKNRSLMVDAGAVSVLIGALFGAPAVDPAADDACNNGSFISRCSRKGCDNELQDDVDDAALGEVIDEEKTTLIGEVAKEALGLLVLLPLTENDRLSMIKPDRLAVIAGVLHEGDMEERTNAGLLVEMLSDSKERPELRLMLAKWEGMVEGLVGLVRAGGGPAARAGVRALSTMCLRRQVRDRAVAAGASPPLVQMLLLHFQQEQIRPPLDRKVLASGSDALERAVATLELLCTTDAGCADVARQGPSAVAALVKSILKVSERATEAAAGALLAICSWSEAVQRAALQAGVMKELLLLIQSDCTERAKAKAMKLLKLLRATSSSSSATSSSCLATSACVADYGRSDVVPF